MNYLFVTPSFYPAFSAGGPVQSNLGLLTAISAQGTNVDVLTTNRDGSEKIPLTSASYGGVKVRYCRSFFGHRLSFSLALKLMLRVKRSKIIHVDDVFSIYTLLALMINIRYNRVFIFSPRGSLITYVFKKEKKFKRLIKVLWMCFLCYLMRKQNKLKMHYTSENERREANRILKLFGVEKICCFISPNGFDKKHKIIRKDQTCDDRIKLVTLGRINHKKRLDLGILVTEKIRNLGFGVTYHIIGNDDDGTTQQLASLVEQKSLQKHVKISGPVYSEKKFKKLAEHDIFLLNSRSENFANVVLEALSVNLPLVITKNLPWKFLSGSSVATICGDEVSQICEAIITQHKSKAKPYEFEQILESYSWKNVAVGFLQEVSQDLKKDQTYDTQQDIANG